MFWKRKPCNCAEAAEYMSKYGGGYAPCRRHQPRDREVYDRKEEFKNSPCWPTQYECEIHEHETETGRHLPLKQAEKPSQLISKEMPYLTSQKAYLMRRINNALAYAAEENHIPMPDYFREEFINLRTEVSRTSLYTYATDRGFTYTIQVDRLVALKTAWGAYRQYVHGQAKKQEARRLERREIMRNMYPARVTRSY